MKNSGKNTSIKIFCFTALMVVVTAGGSAYGQNAAETSRNNPYAPSPAGKTRTAASHTEPNDRVAFIMQPQAAVKKSVNGSVGSGPISAPDIKASKPLAPTEVYKVGVNDVLSIKLNNAASGSDYYTVRPDGSIDFPLAGGNVVVAGMTTAEIEATLASSITLYSNPRLEIKIREYGSHKIMVSGSVSNPGERNLQREAVPFYVIKAGTIISPETNNVKISGSNATDVYDLRDPKLDNVLITPGMTIEFLPAGAGSYFVTGKKVTAGEKAMTRGITLMQAVIAAGKTDGEAKKAIIRRRNSGGILNSMEFDLRAVRSGRIADPVIMAGDIIDIPN
jgi:protein involved in polysaccharide export with SLBB domain